MQRFLALLSNNTSSNAREDAGDDDKNGDKNKADASAALPDVVHATDASTSRDASRDASTSRDAGDVLQLDPDSVNDVKWRDNSEQRAKRHGGGDSASKLWDNNVGARDSVFSVTSDTTPPITGGNNARKKSRDSIFMTLPVSTRKKLRKATTGTVRSSLRTSISVSEDQHNEVTTPVVRRRLSEHPLERYSTMAAANNVEKSQTQGHKVTPGSPFLANLRRFTGVEQSTSQTDGNTALESPSSKYLNRLRGSSFRTSKSTSSLVTPFKVSFVKTPPSSTANSASPSPPPVGGAVWRTPFWKPQRPPNGSDPSQGVTSRTAPPSPPWENHRSDADRGSRLSQASKTAPPSPPFFGGPSPKSSLFGGLSSKALGGPYNHANTVGGPSPNVHCQQKVKSRTVFDRRRSVSDPVALDDDSWAQSHRVSLANANANTTKERKRKKFNKILAKLKYTNAGRGWQWYWQSKRLAKLYKQGSQPTSYSCTNLDFLQQRVDAVPKRRGPPSDSGIFGSSASGSGGSCHYARPSPAPPWGNKGGTSLSGSTQTLSSSVLNCCGSAERRAEQLAELEEQPWYWGPLTRVEAAQRLAPAGDGYFLVRDDDKGGKEPAYCLSFKSHNQVLDTRISLACGGRYYTLYSADASFDAFSCDKEDGALFESVVELVRSLMQPDSAGLLCPVILEPPPAVPRPASKYPPGTIPPPPPQPRREFVRVHLQHPLSRETVVQPLAVLAARALRRAALQGSIETASVSTVSTRC